MISAQIGLLTTVAIQLIVSTQYSLDIYTHVHRIEIISYIAVVKDRLISHSFLFGILLMTLFRVLFSNSTQDFPLIFKENIHWNLISIVILVSNEQ